MWTIAIAIAIATAIAITTIAIIIIATDGHKPNGSGISNFTIAIIIHGLWARAQLGDLPPPSPNLAPKCPPQRDQWTS
jgi:hypothetical protein